MPRVSRTAAVAIVLLAVCASVFAAGLTNLWLDVPFVAQQNKDGCGAASIAMVMQYWERQQGGTIRPAAQPDQILHALYSESVHGIYASAMARYFQSNGYRAFGFTADWMDIERELHYGRPLIVALKPDSGPALHYVVVAGLDEPQQLVLVNDPAQRKLLKEDQSQFVQEWKAAGNWALLAVPGAIVH
jgi:ABC-type bacteriocin/lantibiotic exporter with double-glycine peptidase domain